MEETADLTSRLAHLFRKVLIKLDLTRESGPFSSELFRKKKNLMYAIKI